MLGNMGFNKAVCVSTYTQLNTASPAALQCEAGVMNEITFAGIIPTGIDYTWENIAYGYCGNPNDASTDNSDPT